MRHIYLILVLGLMSQAVSAGIVVTYKDAESGETSQDLYDRGKANFGEMIYTGKHFLVVDRGSKSYWKGTSGQYCQALQAQKKKMEAQMASMPAMYRPVPISKSKVTRKKLGKQSIAGFSATGYEFIVDGSPSGRVWVSSDSGLSSIIDFQRSMEGKMKCFESLDSFGVEGSDIYKKTVKDVFILKEDFRQVVSVDKKSIPADRFKVPAGYKAFNNYEKFMNHLMNNERSGSMGYSDQSEPIFEMPAESRTQSKQKDNVIVEDAKDIANDAVEQAHSSTKRGIQDEISEDVEKGVKGLLDKLF